MEKLNHREFSYVGGGHIDMSFAEEVALMSDDFPRVLSWLREPGARSASNVLFWKTLNEAWARELPGRNLNVSEILHSEAIRKEWAPAISDGLGGTCWLAGLCPYVPWIATFPNQRWNQTEQHRRRHMMEHRKQDVLRAAISGLEKLAWFGLTEEPEKSIQMLAWQLGLAHVQPLPKTNENRNSNASREITTADLDYFRAHAPMDVALYKYAQKLFEWRWNVFSKLKNVTTAASAGSVPHGPGWTQPVKRVAHSPHRKRKRSVSAKLAAQDRVPHAVSEVASAFTGPDAIRWYENLCQSVGPSSK